MPLADRLGASLASYVNGLGGPVPPNLSMRFASREAFDALVVVVGGRASGRGSLQQLQLLMSMVYRHFPGSLILCFAKP